MSDSWLPIAIRRDGPDFKQGYGHIPARLVKDIVGICAHSMEGSLAAAMGELDKPSRQASWTFSNPKAGKLLQHYPLQSVTWGNGSPEANKLFVSVEHEGVAGEDLTNSQVANLIELIPLICKPSYQRGRNLVEHNEMTAYGAQPTACPSGRIPWAEILERLGAPVVTPVTPKEDTDMFLARVVNVTPQAAYIIGPEGKRPITSIQELEVYQRKLGKEFVDYNQEELNFVRDM